MKTKTEGSTFGPGQVIEFRNSGIVRRCHVLRSIGEHNIAEHSWNVAILVNLITNWQPTLSMLQWALVHDAPELETGDVPAPVKWEHPEIEARLQLIEQEWFRGMQVPKRVYAQLPALEKALVKFCDAMELGFWILDQMKMGNSTLHEIYERVVGVEFRRAKEFEELTKTMPPEARPWPAGPTILELRANLEVLLFVLTDTEGSGQ